MTKIKQKVERAIGETFITWYNTEKSKTFSFKELGADPPDLIYSDGRDLLPLEISTAYYNSEDAKMRWGHARKDPNAPIEWAAVDPDRLLILNIGNRLLEKCSATYDVGTILVIYVNPGVTTISDINELLSTIRIPDSVPFSEMYLTGDFPGNSDSPQGYHCWKLFPNPSESGIW